MSQANSPKRSLPLGRYIKAIREHMGLSVDECALQCGVSPVAIRFFEGDGYRVKEGDSFFTAFAAVSGVDLFVLKAAVELNIESLPQGMQSTTSELLEQWRSDVPYSLLAQLSSELAA